MKQQLLSAVTLLAVALALPEARGDPPRVAMVLDETNQAAIRLDVETGVITGRLSVPAGRIFRPTREGPCGFRVNTSNRDG